MTPEQGLIELANARTSEYLQGWKFVRLLVILIDEFGPHYYGHIAEHLHCAPRSLENDYRLGMNPASLYAEKLGLSRYHMEQVQGLEQEEAKSLLLFAAENGLSARALGHEVRQRSAPRGADKPTGAATMNGTNGHDKIYHAEIAAMPAPVSSVQEEGYNYAEEWDDVPFGCLPPDPTGLEEVYLPDNCTPFDVVDAVVTKFGKPYMDKVVSIYGSMW